MNDLVSLPQPIEYAPHLRRRGESRPDTRAIIRRAIRDHCPIAICREPDFINLFHVLDRMPEKHRFTLVRQRVEENRWNVFLMPRAEPSMRN